MTKRTKRNCPWAIKHGGYKTPEYRTWKHMKSRCYNKNDAKYPIYGGRGIEICERWKNSFSNFLHDVGKRPTPTHSIDRINTDGNYYPSNVKWSTKKEQANNRNGNHKFYYKNEYLTVMQISELCGVKYTTLLQRLCILHWSVHKSVTMPLYASRKKVSPSICNDIRQLHSTRHYTHESLAKKFHVDQSTVTRIVNKSRNYK